MRLKPRVFARGGVFLFFEWLVWLSGCHVALCAVLSGLGLVCFFTLALLLFAVWLLSASLFLRLPGFVMAW